MNSRTKKIRAIVKSLENNDELQSQSNQKENFTTTQSQRNICSKTSLEKHRLDEELTADWPLPKQSEYANSFDLVHQYDFTKLMQPLVSPEDLQLDHETSTTQQCPDQPEIVLKYFEPGHTFMSADSFHYNVEQSLQKVQKVYDFGDFTRAVEGASTGKVLVKSMGLSDFYVFKSHIAQQKLRDGQENRVYLKDIVEVMVQRGQYCLFFKKDFDSEEYEKLKNCLKSKKIPDAPVRCVPQGVAAKRKQDLIKKLGPLMPKNRIGFWKQFPVTSGPDERVYFEFENSDEDI